MTGIGSSLVNVWMSINVGKARKKYGVKVWSLNMYKAYSLLYVEELNLWYIYL